MSKNKRCSCHPTVQKLCKPCHCPIRKQKYCRANCNDVGAIIQVLASDDEKQKSRRNVGPPAPVYKTKSFKPMTSYHRFCVPPEFYRKKQLKWFDNGSGTDQSACDKVKFHEDIILPPPDTCFKPSHGETSKPRYKCLKCKPLKDVVLMVPSPKTSGEIVKAEKADVKYIEQRAIPEKNTFDLFKPHSAIVDVQGKGPKSIRFKGTAKTSGLKPCFRGGVCNPKKCISKKCRKYWRKAKRMNRKLMGKIEGEKRRRKKIQRTENNEDDTCGLDETPHPKHPTIPPNLKKGTLETHSLTVLPCRKEKKPQIHYGILTGTFNMYDNRFGGRSRGKQALTMSVMAYCLAFHYHPKQWTMRLIDNIVQAGDQWYIQCADKVHDHSAYQGLCEVLPFGKKQTLVLNRKKMQVLLGEPDVVGYTMSLDPTVHNLCRGLHVFFSMNQAGVLLTRVLKVMIWKDRVCYYIFDPAGRDSRAYSNFSKGSSALINVQNLVAVAEVLLARTIVEDQKFVLAPVKVLKMMDEKADEDFESDKELTQAEKAMMGYRILNENCAIVNANMHLGDRCFEDAKFRQALPVAVVAMTYAKISPPNTWHTKTLDKILRLGNKLYVDCSFPRVVIDITIDNIPNEIVLGPYACEIIIYRDRVKGQLFTTKECLFNIKSGLKDFFSREYNSGILEFNNYQLAIWRQKDMYYLFDPYPRTKDGLRSLKIGKACCLMLLNPGTMASAFTNNWEYLPQTTQFSIHGFKVLKLKKKEPKTQIICTLSKGRMSGKAKVKRKVLTESKAHGDGKQLQNVLPVEMIHGDTTEQPAVAADEEQMGDIISLVDSIQEEYVPPVPMRFKNMPPLPLEERIVNLDSPTVSVTQVVPPWPKPRDKSNEIPDPDPDPVPPTPPTPPPVLAPEGGEEEEEMAEDEEEMERRMEEEARRKAEEEEARRKAEEIPPALPPPPPSPQPEPELNPIQEPDEHEVEALEPVSVERKVLLASDAKSRFEQRKLRKKSTTLPLTDSPAEPKLSPEEELDEPSNFRKLPDSSQIIRADTAFRGKNAVEILPYAAITAIIVSYKYSINTWNTSIVKFVVQTGENLYLNKKEKYQLAPIHIIPKVIIGSQLYHAVLDVLGEGKTRQLYPILKKYLVRYDRGMVTTSHYSCAFFKRNGLYYLFDASPTNGMGLRDANENGRACFVRFIALNDLVTRILYNKDGPMEHQHFVLSRVVVRRLPAESRQSSDPSYQPTSSATGSKTKIAEKKTPEQTVTGYRLVDGLYKIEGTIGAPSNAQTDVKPCHFVCTIAMLMATVHPIRAWDQVMVDVCVQKGLEIYNAGTNMNSCEKRVIKNIMIDGNIIDLNIRKLTVINENAEKRLDQYLRAVMNKLRYVVLRYRQCNLVVVHADGYYHVFHPYTTPAIGKASWTLCRSLDDAVSRINKLVSHLEVNRPEFFTFELVSIKRVRPLVDEKLYWLNIESVPWSRMNAVNDLGFPRKLIQSMWKDWDIEYACDLFSLWGRLHPTNQRFEHNRGNQYLAVSAVAIMMTNICELSAWTSSLIDGIVTNGDKYHSKMNKQTDIKVEDLPIKFDDMFPYSFSISYKKDVSGIIYNMTPEVFNMSKALSKFFDKNTTGLLITSKKCLAFGQIGQSYFMFDCQSFGSPVFSPGQGVAYILKCESMNRLVYCMTITLNVRTHGEEFTLYSVSVSSTESAK